MLFRKFLDSCTKQTLKDVEYILIFDDPTDDISRNILKEYNQSNFIVIENETNRGVNETHHFGLSIAKGEYVAFFDNDDFFDADYLETAYYYIKGYNYPNILKGCAITHYLDDMDYFFEYMIGNTESSNDDDWLLFIKRDIAVKYLENYDFVIEETEDKKFNIYNEIRKAKELPLYEGSFYHYVRHSKNTSKVDINIDYKLNKDNIDCQENTRRHLLEKLKGLWRKNRARRCSAAGRKSLFRSKDVRTPRSAARRRPQTFRNISKPPTKVFPKCFYARSTKRR